ncbi:hypothetical protein [Flavobacterium sp. JP2137]|uniref:hypothetical protein n=1 Tax=Flavobacterium sp. JP2137 TaxID=3414510 RepID=UPI003D2FCCB5
MNKAFNDIDKAIGSWGVSNMLITVLSFHLCAVFFKFFSLYLNLNNPLFPQQFIAELFYPWAFKGLILTTAILLVGVFQLVKLYRIAVLMTVLALILFYSGSFLPNWD